MGLKEWTTTHYGMLFSDYYGSVKEWITTHYGMLFSDYYGSVVFSRCHGG
ncbi:hypothetical protein [Endozoicomonas arenosclerae]|nr:hypothetical protein [Endozoicomonas arenosclerae]